MRFRVGILLQLTARALLVPVLLACCPARALDPAQEIGQFQRTTYRVEDGAPARITAIAQTADGTMWFGTHSGLFHFDGVRFTRYAAPTDAAALSSDDIASLYAPAEGGLWIGFYYGGVVLLKDGVLTRWGTAEGVPDGSVNAVVRDLDGTMWAGTAAGTARLVAGAQRWEFAQGEGWGKTGIENIRSLLVDGDGTLWEFTGSRRIGFLPRGAHRFEVYDPGDPDAFFYYRMPLAVAPDGSLWLADPQRGVRRVDRAAEAAGAQPAFLAVPMRGQILFDRDGNLWAGGAELTRVAGPLARLDAASPHPRTEQIDLEQGLTASLFEDREGNLWTGSNAGLTRISPRPLMRALEGRNYFALATGTDGTLWAAALEQDVRQPLFHFVGDAVKRELETPASVTAVHRDEDGTIWFTYRKILAQLTENGLRETELPASVRGAGAVAMVRARDGAMWISMLRNGVFRVDAAGAVENGGIEALPAATTAFAMARDGQGRLLLGYTGNRLAVVDGREARLFTEQDGLKVGNVSVLAVHGDHVWVGGEHGLARFDGRGFTSIEVETPDLLRQLTGIVERADGDLWLGGGAGVVHLARGEVEAALRDRQHRAAIELFDHRDGLPGTIQQRRPAPTVVETGDGKIWFAASNGLAWIDPARIPRNHLPPPVLIWSITDGLGNVSAPAADLRLPAGTSQIRIAYSANSFTIPERVRFRYRLDGVDKGWRDAENRREAAYTNLAPGTYRFQVVAANNDGVWNETGASTTLTIEPFLWQTGWFRAGCALAVVLSLVALFRLRLQEARASVRARLEERIIERERIARDLHDTLLQGLQGLILRFQAAGARIAPTEPAHAMIERALERADEVLIESRERVKDLRGSEPPRDLPEMLASFGAELTDARGSSFRVTVEGVVRDLHPIVRDEVGMIAREAIGNAFHHAGADAIEVEITFDRNQFRLRVRDDGCGIADEVLRRGLPGHWGLSGMRERAARLRAQYDIWSRKGAGTEIELRVPGALAYQRSASVPWRWRRRAQRQDDAA